MNSDQQIFWTFFITTMCGFLLALGRQMYKSKCTEIDVCCIHIKRDVGTEEKIDEIQIQQRPPNAPPGTDLETSMVTPTNI
jgi:hypothetical protein